MQEEYVDHAAHSLLDSSSATLPSCFKANLRGKTKMLCAYCQAFNFQSMAAEMIADLSKPLEKPGDPSATDGSHLFKYHSTMLGVHSAIAGGCALCSLFWGAWLKNSPNWEWGDVGDFLFADEGMGHEQQSEEYKSAILNSPESFTPRLSFRVCKVWIDIFESSETDDRLFRQAVACVCFDVGGGDPEFLDQFSSRIVDLGIYAKSGIQPQKYGRL
jgi:hypothetical protein